MKALTKVLNFLKCLFTGHLNFESVNVPMVFFEPKTKGNQTRTIGICNRCDSVFVHRGELSKEELAAVAEGEKKVEELRSVLQKLQQQVEAGLAMSSGSTSFNKTEMN